MFAYPRLDTIVWNGAEAPAPARILAFDEEEGVISLVDARGQPARIDFRQGAGSTVTKIEAHRTRVERRLHHLRDHAPTAWWSASRGAARGSGSRRSRRAPSSRSPTRRCSCSVSAAGGSVVWKVRPPSTRVADSVVLPRVDRALRTQVGDLLFLATERELTGVRTRSMQRTASVAFDEPVELLAATPSGDRVFVVTSTGTSVQIVDRYRETRERIDRSGPASVRPSHGSARPLPARAARRRGLGGGDRARDQPGRRHRSRPAGVPTSPSSRRTAGSRSHRDRTSSSPTARRCARRRA